jgi:hypothetical protein
MPEAPLGSMQNGSKFSRVELPDLQERQVTVWLTLRSKSGKVVVDASRGWCLPWCTWTRPAR